MNSLYHRPAGTGRLFRLLLILTLALLAAGCGGTRHGRDNSGYDRLFDDDRDLDLTPLQGRVIVLDPGHGGVFQGVVGLNGLSEADANLGVALYLRGLLEWAGAKVHLTRTTDIDFLTPADSSLAADLKARMALIERLEPEILLSLHHNSNAALDRDMNETQTYYPVGRDGADLDLARAIHKHLSLNLDIRPAKIMAGNFYVLRNSPVPAALGEPSMLSNPAVEEKLFRAEKLELEAKAYFMGLLEYFSGGTPYWQTDADVALANVRALKWLFVPDTHAEAPGLDPSTIRLTLNDAVVPHILDPDGRTVHWLKPENPAGGSYTFNLTARNLAGRTTRPQINHFDIVDIGHRLDLLRVGETAAPQRTLLLWSLRDHNGAALSAPSRLTLGYDDLQAGVNDTLVLSTGGESAGAVFIDAASADFTKAQDFYHTGNCADLLIDNRSAADLPEDQNWVVLTDPEGRRSTSPVINRYPHRISPHQRTFAVPVTRNAPLWLESPGFKPLVASPELSWRDTLGWEPVLPQLIGRTIVVDPTGGGTLTDGAGPLGITGSEINLQVARRLTRLLENCGAKAVLTRNDTRRVPPEEKVLLTNRSHADLFLTIGRNPSGDAWRIQHHFGSRGGSRWARALGSSAMAFTAPDTTDIQESYAYLLRHTPCAAIKCLMPGPDRKGREQTLAGPAHQQAVALALLRSIAAYFTDPDITPQILDLHRLLQTHRTHFPQPDDLDMILIDGSLLWLPGRPDPGVPISGRRHILEIRAGNAWWLKSLTLGASGPVIETLLAGRDGFVGTPVDFEPPRTEVIDGH
jgi:N-acetylmuramoyl-L-alanine amidase